MSLYGIRRLFILFTNFQHLAIYWNIQFSLHSQKPLVPMWDLKFLQQWQWKLLISETLRTTCWKICTNVSKKLTAFISTFYPEEGDNIFLQNFDTYILSYISYPTFISSPQSRLFASCRQDSISGISALFSCTVSFTLHAAQLLCN
jgi:hypothetical protein